jgi:hypothetical protein
MKTWVYLYLAECFLEWEIFQTKFVEEIKERILCSVKFPESYTIYEIMWKIIVEPDRPQMTITLAPAG